MDDSDNLDNYDISKLPPWIVGNLPEELLKTSTLFRFKIPLPSCPDKKVEVDILPDLDLNYEMLEEQMQNIPAQYAFYAAIYSELRLMVARSERNFKIRKGEATREVTQNMKEEGTKLTVSVIKDIVEADDKLEKADKQLQKAQMYCGKIYHMLEAMKLKSELARSLAGFKRNEQNNS